MDKLTASLGHAPQRIAVFRALKLGDLLCAVPAFRALRRAFPEAHIALISLPWASDFVDRYSAYFDEFIPFPGWPGLPEQPLDPARTVAFLQEMQQRNWDVVIQQQGNGTLVNAMLALFGAGAVAGFHPTNHPERFAPNPDLFMPYPEQEHEVKRHVHLMEFLGLSMQAYDLEFPVTDADEAAAQELMNTYGLTPGQFVCLHAGGISGRRWPSENFARVGNALAEQGYRIVMTGTTEERPIIERVQQQIEYPTISIAGQTKLGALGALLKQAALLVSNDTGVSHLAAACAVPSVVVFTSADPAEWAPLNRERHRIVQESEPNTVARVLDEAMNLLKQPVQLT